MGCSDSDKPIEIDRPAPLAVISSSRGEKRVVQKGCVWHHACRKIGLDWKEPSARRNRIVVRDDARQGS